VAMKRVWVLAVLLTMFAGHALACGRLMVRTLPSSDPTGMLAELGVRYQRIEVRIDNQVAITRVRQQFTNDSDSPVSGEYVFELPPGATVSDFAIFDGDRRVAGVVRRKEVARAIYTEAAQSQAQPGLLEQVDDHRFRAQVANVPARGEKRIEIEYREMLVLDSGLVRYRLPLARTDGTQARVKEMVVTAELTDAARIDTVWSNLPAVSIHHHDARKVTASWEAAEPAVERDFELYAKIEPPAAGMRARFHRAGSDPGYVMLAISPPEDAALKRPKDVVFVVDTSGSMEGTKMAQAKRALRYCLAQLAPDDRFNLVRFSSGTDPYESGLRRATVEEVDRARVWVDGLVATGGTDIHSGMMAGLTNLEVTSDRDARPRYVVLVTDGEPTVGVTDAEEILRAVAKRNEVRARVFTFGVDEAAGSQLLARMASGHRGESIAVKRDDDLEARLPVFFGKLVQPLFEDVAMAFTGVPVSSVHPRALPHFYLGRQVVVLGRYRDPGLTTATLTAKVEGKPVRYELQMDLPERATSAPWLERLWAQREVDYLVGTRKPDALPTEVVEEIVRLSIAHTFATPFTSFIAVPEEDKRKLSDETRRALEDARANADDPNRGVGSIQSEDTRKKRDLVAPMGGYSAPGPAPMPSAAPAPGGAGGGAAAPAAPPVDRMDADLGDVAPADTAAPPPAAEKKMQNKMEESAQSYDALDLEGAAAPAKPAAPAASAVRARSSALQAPPPPPEPSTDGKENAGLVNLTKSYTDKLTRMTPDEREKLRTSIQKFTDPKTSLSAADKKSLVETKTSPAIEDQFNNRLQMARSWINELRAKGRPVEHFDQTPKRLQSLYYTNKVQAAKKLDQLMRELTEADGVEAGAAPATAPVPIAPFTWPSPAAPAPDGMDARWRALKGEIAQLRAAVRAQRARVELVEAARSGTAPAEWRPVIEAVRIEPALVKGGSPARVSLAVRHAAGHPPKLAWRAREGNLVSARDGAAVWIAPNVPGAYTIDVTLIASDGKTYSDQVDVEVYQPGSITFSPAHLDERLFHINNALEALKKEHAALKERMGALPAGDATVAELMRALAGAAPRLAASRVEHGRGATIRAELAAGEPAVESSAGHVLKNGVRESSHWEGSWIPADHEWAVVTARYSGPRFHWLVSIPVKDEPMMEAEAKADSIAR
jgi:uncharacterized protein YegL